MIVLLKKKVKQKFLNGEKVLVALSGGVDSAVAVLELKKKKLSPIGVHFCFWEEEETEIEKIKKLADFLKIDLIFLDKRKEFQKKVINYFIKEYQKGNTPNPCIFCNPQVKFANLFKIADKKRIKWIATGHYAQIEEKNNDYFLKKAEDKRKDQSYFLYQLNSSQLAKIIFPLGKLRKENLLKGAKKIGLLDLVTNQSQDVCFFQKEKKLFDFLVKKVKTSRGKIVNEKGKILGNHSGFCFFTLGQRKGIGLSGGPFYVIKKDRRKNEIVVSRNKKHFFLLAKTVFLKRVNWINRIPFKEEKYFFKTRYQADLSPGRIFFDKESQKWKAEFLSFQWAATPGQSLVVYDKRGYVWGGGVISKVFNLSNKG